jgi:hypothetical protein
MVISHKKTASLFLKEVKKSETGQKLNINEKDILEFLVGMDHEVLNTGKMEYSIWKQRGEEIYGVFNGDAKAIIGEEKTNSFIQQYVKLFITAKDQPENYLRKEKAVTFCQNCRAPIFRINQKLCTNCSNSSGSTESDSVSTLKKETKNKANTDNKFKNSLFSFNFTILISLLLSFIILNIINNPNLLHPFLSFSFNCLLEKQKSEINCIAISENENADLE